MSSNLVQKYKICRWLQRKPQIIWSRWSNRYKKTKKQGLGLRACTATELRLCTSNKFPSSPRMKENVYICYQWSLTIPLDWQVEELSSYSLFRFTFLKLNPSLVFSTAAHSVFIYIYIHVGVDIYSWFVGNFVSFSGDCSDEKLYPSMAASLVNPEATSLSAAFDDNLKGFILAAVSGVFIGSSFIIKKLGLRRAGASGTRASKHSFLDSVHLLHIWVWFIFTSEKCS